MSLRACDSCRRRKVRCDRGAPCKQCDQARLPCTYEHNTSKFRLIQPKEEQEESGSSSSGSLSTPSSPTFGHQWYLTPELVEVSISTFFATIYAVLPIFSQAWITEKATEIHSHPESHCLIAAFCAFTLTRCGTRMPTGFNQYNPTASLSSRAQHSQTHGSKLLDDMVARRQTFEFRSQPQIASVVTSFLIFIIHSDLGNDQKAVLYLDESIELARKLGIDKETHYSSPQTADDIMNRRLFWVLYISERAQALQTHKELLLKESIAMPTLESSTEPQALGNLVSLFRIPDDKFLHTWNGDGMQNSIQPTQATEIWLMQLRSRVVTAVLPEASVELAQVDVRLTQIWLSYIIWQLSVTHSLLVRSAPDAAMQLDYPVKLAEEVFGLTAGVTFESLEIRGVGFTRKLFDIAGGVLDVLSTIPFSVDASSEIHKYLNHIQALIEAVNPNQCCYKDMLRERLAEAHIAFASGQGLGLGRDCGFEVHSPKVANYDLEGVDSSLPASFGSLDNL